jgi:plastocyanin
MPRVAALLALAGGSLVLATLAPAQPPATATIRLFQFQPSRLEVAAGRRVTWTNQDQIEHTVTSGTPEKPDGRFDVRLEGQGATGSVELGAPGVYPYFCRRHQSIRGEVW